MSNGNGRRRMRPLAGQGSSGPSATAAEVSRILGDEPMPTVQAARRTRPGFSRTEVSPGLRFVALLLGVWLAFAVLRIQELYTWLAVKNLPLLLGATLGLVVIAATPVAGWRQIWDAVPPVRWQVLLVVLGVVTAPLGIWMGGSITYLLTTYSVAIIAFMVTVVVLRDRRALGTALAIMLLALTAEALYTFSSSAVTMGSTGRVRFGWTLDPNDLAMLFVAFTPLALWMAQRKGGRSIGWLAIAVLLVLAIVPTQSRGAVLGLGAVAVTMIAFGTSGLKRILYIGGITAAAIAVFALASATGADRLADFSDYSGGESRTAIWKRGIVWMTWRPWGYGMDNFPIYFDWLNGNERAAHNSFVQVGVELGVLGLVAFAMLFAHTARELLRQRRHAMSLQHRLSGAASEASLASFVLASMAGTAATGFFLSKAYSGIVLFIQALGIAVLLGYPYWSDLGQSVATDTAAANPSPRGRSVGAPPRAPVSAGRPLAGRGGLMRR